MLRTLIEEGKQVSMIISGSSMAPFLIHARDHICLERPSGELRKGDMVFYQRSNGEYVMHRIYNVKKEEYYLIGDAQTVIEGPIQREQIFAVVTKVKRKGEWIVPENFRWKFFAHVWLNIIPLRETKEFIKRNIAGEIVLVPSGQTAREFNGMVTLTGTGEFIWEHIEETESFSHLVQLILEEYEVDKDTASQDAAGFIMQLLQAGMVRPTGINW